MILTAALALAQPEPAPLPPREVVEHVIAAVRAHYFDPAAAERIAWEVGAESRAGGYDGLAPQELARRLTARLERYDMHFDVRYAPAAGAGEGPAAAPGYDAEIQNRRAGYGFRSVAVLPGNIGYVQLSTFAPIDFGDPRWPAKLAADGALAVVARTDALIMDLRGNGGGDPGMVGYLVSAFVGPERDVYNVFRAGERRQSERPPVPFAGPPLQMPVYVLIDRGTGSAAEAFAYTLQAAGRATIVGQTSVGAANPGSDVPLPGGYVVFVSVASPVNPLTNGNWEGSGVRPDVSTEPAAALLRARLMALETLVGRVPAEERIEAEWALAAARAEADPRPHPEAGALIGRYGSWRVAAEDGQLTLTGGRGPARLMWIEGDTFARADDPAQRYSFRRGADGRAVALVRRRVDGSVSEWAAGG